MNSIRIRPGQWLTPLPLAEYFGNDRPIEVDLGCGKGRFLVERARTHADTNLLGIDRMLRRIRKIDNRVRRLGYPNVRLLRIEGLLCGGVS
jgi:tRNA (guanine-N7-)-methyltransferase